MKIVGWKCAHHAKQLSSAHWQQASKIPALWRFNLIWRGGRNERSISLYHNFYTSSNLNIIIIIMMIIIIIENLIIIINNSCARVWFAMLAGGSEGGRERERESNQMWTFRTRRWRRGWHGRIPDCRLVKPVIKMSQCFLGQSPLTRIEMPRLPPLGGAVVLSTAEDL